MKTYLIGYDLNKKGQDYEKLKEKIKELANGYWHHLDSTWLIKTDSSAKSLRDILENYIDSNDELLVAKLSGESAWTGFNKSGSDWLRNNL